VRTQRDGDAPPWPARTGGTTHTLNPLTLLALPQTFEMVFSQYHQHPEYKSLRPDGTLCKADTCGLLRRYPVTASALHLIGKETERGWEQTEDISTLMPSLVRYPEKTTTPNAQFQERLHQSSRLTLYNRKPA